MKLLHEILGHDLMGKVHQSRMLYPEGFFHWLQFNDHVWIQFEKYANTMAAKRERFSARTIIEVMRWNNDIREKNVLFKLSNNNVPGLARLWMAKYGQNHPKFFQLQEK